MAHEAPDARPWWARFTAAVRYVLALEPVAVAAVWRAVVAVLAAAGFTVADHVDARVAGTIVAVYALVELLTTIRARARVTPEARVVERVNDDGVVVAGPANELPTGSPIRDAGSLHRPAG